MGCRVLDLVVRGRGSNVRRPGMVAVGELSFINPAFRYMVNGVGEADALWLRPSSLCILSGWHTRHLRECSKA